MSAAASPVASKPLADHYDLVIVGAGFGGMYMLHKARALGLSARVFEAADDVGGTWYWNRYPGARCDIESLEYSYSFDEDLQQSWRWSERFATQPEILRYAQHVAERFGLRTDISFNARVSEAHFDESASQWRVSVASSADGAPLAELSARFVVMATGCLSSTNQPDIPGLDSFAGATYHTGQWPHEGVDFTGKRVGVIGTGSSAIQSIPVIAAQAKELTVFQRTPNYSVPAHNAPIDPTYEQRIKSDYANFRARNREMIAAFGANAPTPEGSVRSASAEHRREVFERWWERGGLGFTRAFDDLMLDDGANEYACEFVRGKIHQIVEDPRTAELLSPSQVIGCKRLCVDTDYYATYNRPNVHLVDIRSTPIERITPQGVQVGEQVHALDCLVLATGFDAMTGTLMKIDIRGAGGLTLRDAWSAGPRNYLGLMVAGFPNLFMVTGPGSPSVLTNMIMSIEQHVEFIADCIAWLRDGGNRRVEAAESAQDAWVAHVNEVAGATVFPQCNSWYLGANVPGKARVFMPLLGFPAYVQKCREVVEHGYEGFVVN
ncbi:MAG: NAD(P)/FAD-dependent oxidoreductase [Burkholderiaceae bacterium]|nr:NAD(P)/FAD-dependent oxidoreductase [Burkholderiaceae bacterium]